MYAAQNPNSFIIAARKIRCDCSQNTVFSKFFSAMKKALSGTDDSETVGCRKRAFCIPTGVSVYSVSDEEFLNGVCPLFKMTEDCLELRIQSVKMLCDIATKEARYLELPAFRLQALQALNALVVDESDDVRQHAVMAISVLVDLPTYKEAFIQSTNILPALFSLVENCPDQAHAYETAQVRRTAAAVLAVLSRTHPYSVLSELHEQQCDVTAWMQRAGGLVDGPTRASAAVVKDYLSEVSLLPEFHVDMSVHMSDDHMFVAY
jgi:hypothetical protein